MSGTEPLIVPLSQDERSELERLRAELAVRRAADASPAGPARGRAWVRTTAAMVLITVGCLLGPPSVVALWASSVVGDTDRYVETVAPLANDPALQAAVTEDITNEIFSRIDVDTLTTRAVDALGNQLPSDVAQQLNALAGPIATGIRSATEDQVARVVASDTFAQAWVAANRAAHAALNAALSGDGSGSLQIQNGTVSVNLSDFATAVKERLSANGFALADRIPEIDASFVIMQSDDLGTVQRGYDVLATLGRWLGPIAVVLIALGIYVARSHRRAFIGAGLGLAATMLVSGIALLLARGAYLDAIPAEVLSGDAASTMFDTVVRFLREVIRAVGLLGLVFALGAFFTGSSATATRARSLSARLAQATSNGINSLGLPTDKVGRAIRPQVHVWRIVLVVLAFVGFVIPAYPTPALVLWLTATLLLAMFVIQILVSTKATAGTAVDESDSAPTPTMRTTPDSFAGSLGGA